MLQTYQREFLDFATRQGVLRFGQFTLKSGRVSPYFFNAGLFNTGSALAALGRYYAAAIVDSGISFDMLFGPAYKGIPLVTAVAIAMYEQHHRDVPFAFNRKEVKDHGEGGQVVGAALQGKILIVDDVISAGTSTRESVTMIQTAHATAIGVAIALDRQERGQGEERRSAVQEVSETLHLQVCSIVNLEVLLRYLQEKPDMSQSLLAIEQYRDQYGC